MAEENPLIKAYSENSEISNEIDERYKVADEHFKRWISEAKEDYNFGLGEQWDPDDREKLKNEGRPCLTFNRIKPLINLISGYQRENSARIKVNPEGGEDKVFSEVMDKAIKHVDKRAHLPYKMGYWFDDGCFCGKGFLEGYIDYDKDPIRGDLKFKQDTPYQILTDPDCNEYDLNEGHGFVFKIVKLNKRQLKELYPKKTALINGFTEDTDNYETNGSAVFQQEGSDDDYGNRPNVTTVVQSKDDTEKSMLEKDQKFTVKEYWRPKKVTRYFVISKDDGEPEKFDTEEKAKAFIAEQQFGEVIERQVNQMWVAAKVCGWILDDSISPLEPEYSGYPFFRFIADWAPNAETEILRVQGIVRGLKDPQREKNKAKSQNLHILNTQANSGWVGDKDALSPQGWKNLEKMGSKPGVTVKKKKGSELREIQAKGLNAGQIQREEKADEEFKQIAGINPDLMGFQEGTASGKAISLRIKQAILALVRIFSNYRYSKEVIGLFILQMVPKVFDVKKLKKVLGPAYMQKALDPKQYPEGLTDGHLDGFLKMVKDNRYDVFVSEADQNSTIRYEIFTELTELLKAGAPIPTDLIIEYLDLPNSQEIKDRIRQEAERLAAAQAAKGKQAA